MGTPDLKRHPGRPTEPEAAAPRPLPEATNVSGWLLSGVIREEAEYVVYAARRGPTGAHTALKLLDLNALHDAAYFRHLRRAARRWKRARNAHLATLVDGGRSPAGPYLATIMVEGPTLAERLAVRTLGPVDTGFLAVEVAGALDALVGAGLTPAAITPRDITMTASGAVVTDPGVGRGPSREELVPSVDAAPYLSPEEARGSPVQPRSSVYSLACVLHECLTGAPPYPHDLIEAVLYAHVAEAPPRPSRVDPSLPETIDAVFERAMADTPKERHASPGEFARDLVGALGAAQEARTPGPRSMPESASTRPAPKRRRDRRGSPGRPRVEAPRGLRRAAALAVATAACAGAGFAVGSAGGSEQAPEPRAAPAPPASAVAAQRVADELGDRRVGLRRRLSGARRRAGQARIATLLARLHGRAARAAGSDAPALRTALSDAQRAYLRMARAARARRGRSAVWARGRSAARRADATLRSELDRAAG